MMWASKVSRSTMAAQSRGSVKVDVHSPARRGRDGDGGAFFSFGEDLEQQLGRLATTPEQAMALLRDAVAVLEARAEFLAATGKRGWRYPRPCQR
jgi:hypothetical protein